MAGYIGSKSSVTLVDGITEEGGTLTGDLSFGDNDKAIFGAGSDLEIYHDGSRSLIRDSGTGNLLIRASNLSLQNADGTNYINAVSGAEVNLYHNNSAKLATTATGINVTGDTDTSGLFRFGVNNSEIANNYVRFKSGGAAYFDHSTVGQSFNFRVSNSSSLDTNAMTIDSSGNLLVGRTQTGDSTAGGMIRPDGFAQFTRDGNIAADFKRINSDGDIVRFQKDSATVGTIGVNAGSLGIGQSNTGLGFFNTDNMVFPATAAGATRDNAIDLGYSAARFDDIYATNGTIQTSDFNEKQDIDSLTATEMLVGKRISALFKTFRWKDSVAEKGDNARTHTGVIAQDVQAAFTAEGLDAGDYALFISNTWWETQTEVPAVEAVEAVEEVVDEDGNVTTEAVEAVEAKDAYTRTDTYDTEDEAPEGATSKTRMGIRYPELLSFIAAYNEQRFASIEARLTALEA